jgi:hypothetical protein
MFLGGMANDRSRFNQMLAFADTANCPVTEARPLCRLLRRAFFRSQCRRTASVARESHWVFRRSFSNSAVAKYLTVWAAHDPPKGFNSPAAIKTGISCGLKPRYVAACSACKRAGYVFKFRKSSLFTCEPVCRRRFAKRCNNYTK